jgi:hypothetical protein
MTPSSTGDSVSDLRFYEMYERAGYHPDIFFRSNDVESILMMVSAEEGISIIPSYVTQKLTNADNLVFIPLIGEEEVVEESIRESGSSAVSGTSSTSEGGIAAAVLTHKLRFLCFYGILYVFLLILRSICIFT